MTLHVFALFHLNLAFSSIEEEARPTVVERCYWPLLRLAENEALPLAVEATGYTLETIEALAPDWTATLRGLVEAGRIEFVGSGYAQLIGPLAPATVNRANLRLGHAVYERIIGRRPKLALVNEQAFSGGLVPLYGEAGYDALIMDYDNCAHRHPEWSRKLRFSPQTVLGTDNHALGLLWTNTVAFQKAQRLAHGEIDVDDYLAYVKAQCGDEPRAFALYGNDAEVFDFRPGRLATEAPLTDRSEWQRFARGLLAARDVAGVAFARPSSLLARDWPHRAAEPLRLETAACPIPVKKQHKYNITRWAVTGRDDLDINTRCYRLTDRLCHNTATDADWRELVYLWSSDFRTHITKRRWDGFRRRLARMEKRFAVESAATHDMAAPMVRKSSNLPRLNVNGRLIEVETDAVRARFNKQRGLALDAAWFGDDAGKAEPALCGTLRHGHFDDIHLAFDWYSGTVLYDRPAAPKITDLAPTTPQATRAEDGSVILSARIGTALGPVSKQIRVRADRPQIDYDIGLDWYQWGPAALRLGNFTLKPDAFNPRALTLRTQNGGAAIECFALSEALVDHGAPVSLQVSANCGLGLTEGWLDIGDNDRRLSITVDKSTAALIGMVTLKPIHGSVFCRVSLSGLEYDETFKPATEALRPRRFRFAIGGV